MTALPTAAPSLAGSILADRYALRALLGRGGMGEVYEAVDLRLDRTVAVKVLQASLAEDRRFVARFDREARTSARLDHPGIVKVFDVGEDQGRVFTVLEHVPGHTLSELRRQEQSLAAARVAAIGAGIADALAHAHARGVVHRDVAPGNVMVRGDGVVKVLDFGIARALRGSGASVTLHGTVAYAAPEVLAGEQGDQRVDIYGLGAVLYELLTGQPPFTGSDADAIAARLRAELPRSPRSLDPDVPPGLEETVMRCLARQPSARVDDAATLSRELHRLAAFLPEVPSAVEHSPSDPGCTEHLRTPTLPEPSTENRAVPISSPRSRRRLRLAVVLLAAGILAAATVLVVPAIVHLRSSVSARLLPPRALPAPTTLDATAECNAFFSAAADLRWTAVSGADSFEVWRRGQSGETWSRVTTTDAATTSYRNTDLGTGTGYVFRVRALDGPLPGRWSAPVSVDTPSFCLG
jgi:serine/threonine protein kinase